MSRIDGETLKNIGRVPPQDIVAEQHLLGAMLIDKDVLLDTGDRVSEDSFYAYKHQVIYRAISELSSRNDPIDIHTVSTYLRETKELDQVGGESYMIDLASIGTSANASYYAEIVRKKDLLRRLISAGSEITEVGYEEHEDLDAVLDQAEKKIYEVTHKGGGTARLVGTSEMMEDAFARIEKMSESHSGVRGVPSGFVDLDAKLSGWQKGDLVILAARPANGKTSLALDFARNAAVEHNVPVALFSMEMTKEQLVDRMLSAQSNVDSYKMRTGKLSMQEEFERLQMGLAALGKAPIYIDDTPGNNIMQIRSVLRRLKTENPLGLVVIDYLQLMQSVRRYDSTVAEVTEISRSLKGLAKEFNVPVIALSQLSRAVESRGGRPKLSDLRDSGSIEQDADIVMFIHREDKNNEENERRNIAEICIEKHRNGPTGIVELYFDGARTSFNSISKSDFGDFSMPSVNVTF